MIEDLGLASKAANSRRVPHTGDIPHSLRTIWLWRGGSCWGGYDLRSTDTAVTNRNLCMAPAYFSPGQWRLFARYLTLHKDLLPFGHESSDEDGFMLSAHVKASQTYTAEAMVEVLESAIVWGYNTLNRISCSNGMVTNWWTLPQGDVWPWDNPHGLKCSNSATDAGAYGADAVRIPWRIALDYLWFPEETMATPLFGEDGKRLGVWGAKEYSNRWSSAWIEAIRSATDASSGGATFEAGSYPPLREGIKPLRPDQILPLLSKLSPCAACPKGFMASPWNGWGERA